MTTKRMLARKVQDALSDSWEATLQLPSVASTGTVIVGGGIFPMGGWLFAFDAARHIS